MTLTRYIPACDPANLLMPIGTWAREERRGEMLRPRLYESAEDAREAGNGAEPLTVTITVSPP